jgi:ParB family transcriptional regulator, chromosome partitioning protein
LAEIPGIFADGNHAEIALVENLVSQDLTAVEEAEALHRIMNDYGYKQEDLAKIIGKAKSTLSEILSLNKLPQEIRDECRNNPMASKNILIEIAKKRQTRSTLSAYRGYKEKKLSKEQLKKQRQARKAIHEVMLSEINKLTQRTETTDRAMFAEADKDRLRRALSALIKALTERIGLAAA